MLAVSTIAQKGYAQTLGVALKKFGSSEAVAESCTEVLGMVATASPEVRDWAQGRARLGVRCVRV